MRWTDYYLFTAREVPADAEVVSHRLMLRAGMIRKAAAGIYSYLPFGWRSLEKLSAIVRRELNAKGALELTMPAVQPAELWQETGRWQKYGKELLRIKDRHQRDFCFAPTAEEVVTDIVRNDVRSYRQLPFNLYQIHTKFRDEIRPRFGLMRGREFLMKDAYSFHAGEESLDATYRDMADAYRRIFEACGLDHIQVEADTGTIGGSSSHEFMVVAQTGESLVVRCPSSSYAANVERAEAGALEVPDGGEPAALEEVATPGKKTIQQVAEFLDIDPRSSIKALVYDSERDERVLVFIRGDREVNEIKLANHLDVQHLVLASEAQLEEFTGSPVGFVGPVGLPAGVRVIADLTVKGLSNFVCGANRLDFHLKNVNWGRDAEPSEWVDLLHVRGGDPSPDGQGMLEEYRGIEVGHIFKLGNKYSTDMGCTYLDQEGKSQPMEMGCYGLGIGRTVAAAIEQNHDDDGIIWPLPLAPFQVLLLGLNTNVEEVCAAADMLYDELREQGIEVLYDDRKERPGVKFKDADLIGIPLRVVVGKRSLDEGKVEFSLRRDREKQMIDRGDVVAKLRQLIDN